MRRALIYKISQCSTKIFSPHPPPGPHLLSSVRIPHAIASPAYSLPRSIRLFSTDDTASSPPNSDEKPNSDENPDDTETFGFEDVSNEEFFRRIRKYWQGDEGALPSVFEAILARRVLKTHELTDDELKESLAMDGPVGRKPLAEVSTDDDFEDLYDPRAIVENRMKSDPYFNMDDKKWDKLYQEGVEAGDFRDPVECEMILDEMLNGEKPLPDDVEKRIDEKVNEIEEKCKRQELEPEEAYKQLKAFQAVLVEEYRQKIEAEGSSQLDAEAEMEKNIDPDDPPGEGPILMWQTRCVFAPGESAWHPKNRKVKLSVNVKELGLSRYQFMRMKEIVGPRYDSGRNELTIISERFEEREENKKDCFRTLLKIIEEAGKASKLAEETRGQYFKEKLKRNPKFMARFHAKIAKQRPSSAAK